MFKFKIITTIKIAWVIHLLVWYGTYLGHTKSQIWSLPLKKKKGGGRKKIQESLQQSSLTLRGTSSQWSPGKAFHQEVACLSPTLPTAWLREATPLRLGTVVSTCNPNTREAETGRPRVQDQPRLHGETLSKTKGKKESRERDSGCE